MEQAKAKVKAKEETAKETKEMEKARGPRREIAIGVANRVI